MRHLENTGLLILSGFFFLFFQKPDYTFICAFLLSVGTCCAGYFSESKKLHLFLCAAFMAAALALPEMCAFFPAVFYVLIQDHFYLPALAGCFLYLYIIRTINSNIFLFPSGASCSLLWHFSFSSAPNPKKSSDRIL